MSKEGNQMDSQDNKVIRLKESYIHHEGEDHSYMLDYNVEAGVYEIYGIINGNWKSMKLPYAAALTMAQCITDHHKSLI